jgi:molybdate transport repressor ModE-like protein
MTASPLPNLSRIAALESVYRTGSFAAAAADQQISVPGLSSRLSALEKETGAPLLRRSSKDKRKLVLTWQGQALARFYGRYQAELNSVLETISGRAVAD